MVSNFKNDFPLLQREFYDKPLVYLDSAATTQKPQAVIDAVDHYYAHDNANVHRGIYKLSEAATTAYEQARKAVAAFVNAPSQDEIVFTKGTTESINLVATTYGERFIQAGDEIVISTMEHHSNIVPWQLLCERNGAILKVIPMSDDGVLDLDAYRQLLTTKTKMVAVVHVSNVLGVINPVKQMIEIAHAQDIPVLIDGAQALPHMPVDVTDLDCDFYVFSAHKMYGPTGIGGLYAKKYWLEQLPPYQGGGDMIYLVSFEKTEYSQPPFKFEAGTPNMAGVAGFKAAIEYLNQIGFEVIQAHEAQLYQYARMQLQRVPGIRLIGQSEYQCSVVSFTLDDVHPHDISTILDQEAVAIRAGHHCAMPLMQRLKLPATARMSLGLYNDTNDIDRLCEGLHKAVRLFRGARA